MVPPLTGSSLIPHRRYAQSVTSGSRATNERGDYDDKLVALVLLCLMTGTAVAQEPKVTLLMSKDLPENPGREALMITVEHAPGGRAGGLAERHVPAAGRARVGAERGVRSGGRTILIDAGLGVDPNLNLPRAGRLALRLEAAGIDLSSVTDVVLTHLHMDHIGGLLADGVRGRLRPDLRVHVAAAEAEFWASPDISRVSMPAGFPDALRSAAKRFLNEYHGQLRTFEEEYEVTPGVVVRRTGGHTPGHSVVRLASGGDRLMFAGDAVFAVGFEHPEWYNGFEHDPEEAARVRVRLLRELAATGESLVATHLSFPSVCHVAVAGDVFLGPSLGVLTACWVRAERDDRMRLNNWSIAAWARWLGRESRCIVPFNSFSEFNKADALLGASGLAGFLNLVSLPSA